MQTGGRVAQGRQRDRAKRITPALIRCGNGAHLKQTAPGACQVIPRGKAGAVAPQERSVRRAHRGSPARDADGSGNPAGAALCLLRRSSVMSCPSAVRQSGGDRMTVTNSKSGTNVHEIAAGIFRMCRPISPTMMPAPKSSRRPSPRRWRGCMAARTAAMGGVFFSGSQTRSACRLSEPSEREDPPHAPRKHFRSGVNPAADSLSRTSNARHRSTMRQ